MSYFIFKNFMHEQLFYKSSIVQPIIRFERIIGNYRIVITSIFGTLFLEPLPNHQFEINVYDINGKNIGLTCIIDPNGEYNVIHTTIIHCLETIQTQLR